jgi:hypothetical protein
MTGGTIRRRRSVMHSRPIHFTAQEHLEDLDYLIAHCQADPRATHLVAEVEAARIPLRARMDDWTAKGNLVIEAQTALLLTQERLDNTVRTTRSVILDDVEHDHNSPKLLIYLPRGLKPFIAASYMEKAAMARSMAERCAQDPSPKVQAAAGPLSDAANDLTAALERRQDAAVAESAAYGQLQVEKLHAIDTCREIAHRLEELYPHDRARVRSYFRQNALSARSPASSSSKVEPPTPAPVASDASA